MKTKVVNINKEDYDVYIGRDGKGLNGYFGNPFKLLPGQESGDTLDAYSQYFFNKLENDPEFRRKVNTLKNKKLGCFCKPKKCHGDIIVEYLNKPKFKILVCGSREIKNKEAIFSKLDYLTSKRNLSEIEIIQGGQKSFDSCFDSSPNRYHGADYFAKLWAEERGVEMTEFKADWGKYGKAAGPIRNNEMLNYSPDVCVAFLSTEGENKGTKNMLKLSFKANILTRQYII